MADISTPGYNPFPAIQQAAFDDANKTAKMAAIARSTGVPIATVSNSQDVPESFSVIKPDPITEGTIPPYKSPQNIPSSVAPKVPSNEFTQYLTSKQGMIDTVLPVMAAIETISTQGKSPGTTSLGEQDFLMKQQQADAQAKKDALAAAIGEKRQKQEEDYKNAILGIQYDKPNAQQELVKTIAAYGSPADAAGLLERQISQGGKQVAPLSDAEKAYVNDNPDMFAGGIDVWSTNPAAVRTAMAAAAKQVAINSGMHDAGFKQTVDEAGTAKAVDEKRRSDLAIEAARIKHDIAVKPPAPVASGSADDAYAKMLVNGSMHISDLVQMFPSRGASAGRREAIVNRALQLDPTYNPAESALAYKWANNPGAIKTVAAANNAIANVDAFTKLSDEWDRSGSPGFNALLAKGLYQVGDKTVTNIQEMQIALGDEAAMVLGAGGASDLKTKLGIDLVNPNVSAENFRSNMNILKHMLETRRNTMADPMGTYANRPGINQAGSVVPVKAKIGRFDVEVH